MLSDTISDVGGLPWEKVGIVALCLGAVAILWRLVGKIAGDKDGLNQKLVDFYRVRAEEMAAMTKSYENALSGNTTAFAALTKQQELTNELLKDFIREFEKRNR